MSEPVVILGVTGSIAAYKAAEITSRLTKAGVAVHVVMTASAERFITPLTFQTLSRHEVVRHEPTMRPDWKPLHIELADSASLLLIAPATANILAELAHGFASHPLTEIALANRAPLLLAPAMNGHMWQHPATQANIEILSSRGARFVGPEDGQLACGYEGVGRMAEPETIVKAALSLLQI